jgi:transcriptional regulator with XRE-family HTH domain
VTRNALVTLLAARGWTDADLAGRAGLDRAHVNQIKNGRALPTVATALALARALGVPVATAFPPGSAAVRRPARGVRRAQATLTTFPAAS